MVSKFFYLLIFLFFYCSITIDSFESFQPEGFNYHNTARIGNKLYFLGGNHNYYHLKNFFYLDLSVPFNKNNPSWYNLDIHSIPFGVSKAAIKVNGTDSSTIFLIGGERNSYNRDTFYYVYSFNSKSYIWSRLEIGGITPKWHWDMKGFNNKNNKEEIYIYGGWSNGLSNKLYILNTMNLSWTEGPDSISSRCGYTVSLLPNGIVVIIGGYVDDGNGLDKILLYDTNKNSWDLMVTQGIQLTNRTYHSAVLVNNEEILVYGGINYINEPDLVVLNTGFQPYKWSAPNVYAPNSPPPSLYGHSADIVGNYMIIAFGYIGIYDLYNHYIYLMDIRNTKNYTWVADFQPEENIVTKTVTTTTSVTETNIVTTTTAVSIITVIPEPFEPPEKYFITKRWSFRLLIECIIIFGSCFLPIRGTNSQDLRKHIDTYFFVLAIYILFVFEFNIILFSWANF
ncbi:hypothetical protein Glove_364g44 [Diversispora epigaea]|uniref:Attractin/MKLN-like beta-propeller domain-containing protein n=1 Tax=Diversispora epigaea TaxID=1348612 RepID=A0A397H9G8_9GLOM|nr:hypothetical protein Glove_364g44 [Diversispora epigaea]